MTDYQTEENLRLAEFQVLVDKHNLRHGTNVKFNPIYRSEEVVSAIVESNNKLDLQFNLTYLNAIDQFGEVYEKIDVANYREFLDDWVSLFSHVSKHKGGDEANKRFIEFNNIWGSIHAKEYILSQLKSKSNG